MNNGNEEGIFRGSSFPLRFHPVHTLAETREEQEQDMNTNRLQEPVLSGEKNLATP